MKTCPTCQRSYEDDAAFCPRDGTPIPATDPLLGQVLDRLYEVLELVGAGRTGKVYRARHLRLELRVALKVFAPELERAPLLDRLHAYMGRVKRARLAHQHVVTVRYVGMDASRSVYMVMDYAEGRPLDRELEQLGRLPVGEALEVLRQLAQGLDETHAARIFYNPLRPADVMFTRTPDARPLVKLLPPSIEQLSVGGARDASDARADAPYSAPETLRADPARPDARADIYSLAAICCELLAGRVRFAELTARAPGELSLSVESVTEWPDVTAKSARTLAPLIARALATDPAQRPATAGAFVAEVEACLKASVRRRESLQRKLERVRPPRVQITDDVEVGQGAKGESRSATEAGSQQPLYADENVQFTVYRPEVVAPGRWYTMLAFAHLSERRADAAADEPDPLAEVERIAARVLADEPAKYKSVRQDSAQAVPRKGELTFVPVIEGCEFNPPSQSFFWQKSVHKVEFELCAAAALDGRAARGRLTVFLGSLILADVPLTLRVDAARAQAAPASPVAAASAQPYRKIFASYSHRDREIVEQIEHHIQVLGDKYLRDVTELRAGQDWQRWMRDAIREADVFQLFWSHNAMRSTYVRAEWEYALALARPNFVRPIYWETPLPESPAENLPPAELRRLHFQHLRPALGTHPAAPATPPTAPTPAPPPTPRTGPPPPAPAPAARRGDTPAGVCRHCGAPVSEEKAFCLNCGAPTMPDTAAQRPDAPALGATVIVPPSQWSREQTGEPAHVRPGAPPKPAPPPAPVAQPAAAARPEEREDAEAALSVFWQKRKREAGKVARPSGLRPRAPVDYSQLQPAKGRSMWHMLWVVLLWAVLIVGLYLLLRGR
ncbi:MAG TPA: TIR domain-containing protein [Pyrinomonadaceae bacterium]|jgi:serine/threonine protein kinase